jgi:hypothetical protein
MELEKDNVIHAEHLFGKPHERQRKAAKRVLTLVEFSAPKETEQEMPPTAQAIEPIIAILTNHYYKDDAATLDQSCRRMAMMGMDEGDILERAERRLAQISQPLFEHYLYNKLNKK